MNGKGDKPRPKNTQRYCENYDSINWGKSICYMCQKPADPKHMFVTDKGVVLCSKFCQYHYAMGSDIV